jgi:lipopolysaccharide transport system permease protein
MHRTHIKANQPWWIINWRELFEYRDLFWLTVHRDLTSIYKQSVLGPLWFILQPVMTTVVFTVIFGNFAKMSTDGLPPLLFYMSGLVLWNYFQGVLNGAASSLMSNAGVLRKVYFPRLLPPLSSVVTYLGHFLINLTVFLGFFTYFLLHGSDIHPSWWILPVLVLHCACVGLGAGLWLSAMTIKYRDVSFALPFLTQLWMFASPVILPSSNVPAKWKWIVAVNPMSGVIELNRFAFLGAGSPDRTILIVSFLVGIALLVSGLFIFNRAQRTFVDTI